MMVFQPKETIDGVIIDIVPAIVELMIKSKEDEVIVECFKCLDEIQEEVKSIVSLPFDNIITEF